MSDQQNSRIHPQSMSAQYFMAFHPTVVEIFKSKPKSSNALWQTFLSIHTISIATH